MSPVSTRRSPCPVHERFSAQVERAPDAIALISESQRLTYRELDSAANRLAQLLRAEGVRDGYAVALCFERSTNAILALLAILKAGGAYVPLDPTHPAERQSRMLRVSGARLILTDAGSRRALPPFDGPLLLLDDMQARLESMPATAPDVRVSANDRAYIMFTSGSTGEPNGVEVAHRGIDRLVHDVTYVELGPQQTLLHAAPLAFDASTFEIFGALLTGGTLVIHPEPVPTARGLGAAISRFGVTTMWLTAGLFNAVIDEAPEQLVGLAQLLVGGEALSVAHIKRAQAVLRGTQLINGYGPTETTTFAACYRIPELLSDELTSIPIGHAITETALYVLSEERRPVEPGVLGELYIGGDGVALGYQGRPDLTAERFLPDPFAPPGRLMYKTGDLVRQLASGAIEYVGRVDTQVKIDGHRIEPGEIEAVLRQHPAVRDCAVTTMASGPFLVRRLVAYIVRGTDAPDQIGSDVLRAHLQATLPAYMVPHAFVDLPRLPLTPNGKVDLRALPEAPAERAVVGAWEEPRAGMEKIIAEIVAELLGVPHVGTRDSFADLGFTSLLVVRAVERLRSRHAL
ncbi:MAG: non-ribosomal peptide synthetase, partial [Gemmatimonadaceae bacterium]